MRSAWRSPSGCSHARFGDGAGRSPDLCHRRRRLPHGGPISHEAISLAGHLRLEQAHRALGRQPRSRSTAAPALSTSDDQLERFAAGGWDTAAIDGHDPEAIAAALARASATSARPSSPAAPPSPSARRRRPGRAAAHGAALGAAEIAGARQQPRLDASRPSSSPSRRGAAGARSARAARRSTPRLAPAPRRCRARAAERIRAHASRVALPEGWRRAIAGVKRQVRRRGAEDRDAAGLGHGARRLGRGAAGAGRRLGRSHRLQQHQGQGPEGRDAQGFLRQLPPLRRARAWHGGGDERPRGSMAASFPMAAPSSSSPITAGRRSVSRR